MNYASKAKAAERMIAKFGMSGTISRVSETGYNPVTEAATTATLTASCQAVRMQYAQRLVDGVIIKPGDAMLYVSAVGLGLTPRTGDTLAFGGDVWRFEQVDPLCPAGTAIFFECRGRKL